jgi:hypothetical protein
MIMFTLKLVTLMLLSVVILVGLIIIAGVFFFGWLSAKTTAAKEEVIEPNPFVAGDLVRMKSGVAIFSALTPGVAYPVLCSVHHYILLQPNPPLGGFHFPHTFFEKVDNRLIDLDKEYNEAIEAISSMEKLK